MIFQTLSVKAANLWKQIPGLEQQVKDATPDQRKLKSLQLSIEKLEEGKVRCDELSDRLKF